MVNIFWSFSKKTIMYSTTK